MEMEKSFFWLFDTLMSKPIWARENRSQYLIRRSVKITGDRANFFNECFQSIFISPGRLWKGSILCHFWGEICEKRSQNSSSNSGRRKVYPLIKENFNLSLIESLGKTFFGNSLLRDLSAPPSNYHIMIYFEIIWFCFWFAGLPSVMRYDNKHYFNNPSLLCGSASLWKSRKHALLSVSSEPTCIH